MKRYLKLVDFELGRFFNIYLVLAGITIISQMAGTYLMAADYMKRYETIVYTQGQTIASFIESQGRMSLASLFQSGWYFLPVLFAAAALIFYCFFIWYRDWFGKNTFIYRLLMLPTARINIFFSKATAIFLMVMGLVALQIILLVAGNTILTSMIPGNLRIDMAVNDAVNESYGALYYNVLIPGDLVQFFIHYGVGFAVVFILFTAILFERSYRLKGVFIGGIYSLFAIALLVFTDILTMILQQDILYPTEKFMIDSILWALVTVLSIWVSHYLLNRKVRV